MSKKQQDTIKSYANYIESHYQEQKKKSRKAANYWRIPVTWEECGIVCIPKSEEINSIQKALNYVSEHLNDIELKSIQNTEYVDSSFRLTHENVEDLEVYQ